MKFLSNLEVTGVATTPLQTTAGAIAAGSTPAVYGVKAITAPPEISTVSISLASQTLWLIKQELTAFSTINIVTALMTAVAATPAASFTGYAIYSESGNTVTRIAVTADDSTLFTGATGSWKPKSFAAPVDMVPGVYWIGVLCNAATGPTLRATVSGAAAPMFSGLPSGATIVNFTSRTSFPTSFDKTSWGASAQTQRFLMAIY